MRRLKIGIKSVDQPVQNLSGGQRQAVAVARAIAWGTRIVIMDEPTAALGVRESSMVLELIKEVRSQGLSIDHDQPQPARGVRGRRPDHGAAARPDDHDDRRRRTTSLEAVVGMMTGAVEVAARASGRDEDDVKSTNRRARR